MSLAISSRAGWVLVGGRSSRMGRDKATAELDGKALAIRVANQVAAVCPTVSLVGDPQKYGGLGLPVVADRFAGEGPLAGIEAALSASACDANCIIACDMPSVSASLLEALFASDGDCVIPRHDDGRLEPLCAVYQRRCHPIVLSALESGVRKVIDLYPLLTGHGLAVRYVRVPDPGQFANLNTPEDWQAWHHG